MKMVVLDGYTENPGDLSWAELEKFGEVTVYDRTSYTDVPIIAERIGDAEIVVINKTPISRETIDKCPNIKLIAVLATGYNVVDCAYAREKGISVGPTPSTAPAMVSRYTTRPAPKEAPMPKRSWRRRCKISIWTSPISWTRMAPPDQDTRSWGSSSSRRRRALSVAEGSASVSTW